MSSFRQELEEDSRHIIRVPCSVYSVLEQLNEQDAAEVREALNDSEITGAAIARVIGRRFNIVIGANAIQRHRRRSYGRGCQCA